MTLAPSVRIPRPPGFPQDDQAYQHGPVRVLITPSEDHGAQGQWRHVSVSCADRLPTYEELGTVRELYFDASATVLQIMPPASAWVNQHQFCLHLWQRLDTHVLPEGLHATVGIIGGLPLDVMELSLLRKGHDTLCFVRNWLRSRGSVTADEAFEKFRPNFKGSSHATRRAIREALHTVAEMELRVEVDGDTYTWIGGES